MKKANTDGIARRGEIAEKLREKMTDLIVAHGLAATLFQERLQPPLDAYNEAVREAIGWAEDIGLQGLDISEARMPLLPDFDEIVDGNPADDLDNLPAEPRGQE
jgi:hypothetical protein